MMMRKLGLLLLTGLVCLGPAAAQSKVSEQGPHRMEVVLEKREGATWKVIDPGLVLARNEKVRFRFKANFDGYLYVTNRSTSGNNSLLFPREDTGTQNRIEAGKEYVVPATAGAFRVDGPPGHDVVSWMVSPVELNRPASPMSSPNWDNSRPEKVDPSSMKPRCDDAIFKARGECVDTAAGLRQSDAGQGRELVIIKEKKASVVSAMTPLTGPVVYEFRLAHR
jgi:hypothetical protein